MIADIDLDHVAVALERQADAWPRYAGDLSGRWIGGGDTVGFASAQVGYANGMKLEVLEPWHPEENDFLRRFLDRSGPGPHHLTYKVGDIVAALGEAEAAGYCPVGVDLSSDTWKEAFLHPKDAPGIVVQLAQASGSDWGSEAQGLPPPRTPEPAVLDRVVHAVASLDDGLRLFAHLLAGRELDRGEDIEGNWVELGWPGPGRVRLLQPRSGSAAAGWLGERAGRLHHLAFRCSDPGAVPDARAWEDGRFEVPPEHNFGVRLVLTAA